MEGRLSLWFACYSIPCALFCLLRNASEFEHFGVWGLGVLATLSSDDKYLARLAPASLDHGNHGIKLLHKANSRKFPWRCTFSKLKLPIPHFSAVEVEMTSDFQIPRPLTPIPYHYVPRIGGRVARHTKPKLPEAQISHTDFAAAIRTINAFLKANDNVCLSIDKDSGTLTATMEIR